MLKTTTYKDLDLYFQSRYEGELRSKCESLRSAVSDNSKWQGNLDLTNLRLPNKARKFTEMVKLICFHWYFPEEIRWLFKLWIEDNIIAEYSEVLTVMLTSKDVSLGYLLIQDLWSDRDLWGNILPTGKTKEGKIKPAIPWFNSNLVGFCPKTGKVKRVQRHRGYRDKGTLRFPHEEHGTPSFVEEEWILEFLDESQKLRGQVLLRKILNYLETEKISS